VSTTLIQAGSAFRLGRLGSGVAVLVCLGGGFLVSVAAEDCSVVLGSAWRYVTEHSWRPSIGQRAAETVDAGHVARMGEGTECFNDLANASGDSAAWCFGAGGLIHVAVGLSGGAGGLLTKRSGVFRKAMSRIA